MMLSWYISVPNNILENGDHCIDWALLVMRCFVDFVLIVFANIYMSVFLHER